MFPILWRTEWGFVYTFTVLMGVAVLGSLWWVARRSKLRPAHLLEGATALFVGSIIGGRLSFVIGNLPYYAENLAESWRWWRGGLGYFGVLWGGLLVGWLWSRWRKPSLLPHLPLLTLPLITLHAAGWLACLLDGCAYGAPTTLAWYTVDWPDSYGVWGVRYPVQLLGLGVALLTFLLAWRLRQSPATFWLAAILLLLGHSGLTLLRGDQIPLLAGWRLDTLAGVASVLGAACVLIFIRRGLQRQDFV